MHFVHQNMHFHFYIHTQKVNNIVTNNMYIYLLKFEVHQSVSD